MRALARALIGEPEQADLFHDGTRDQTIGVRLKGVRIENGRHFGNVYLCIWRLRCGVPDEFTVTQMPTGKEKVPWREDRRGLVAARLCEPSSELHIAEDWYRPTALSAAAVERRAGEQGPHLSCLSTARRRLHCEKPGQPPQIHSQQ